MLRKSLTMRVKAKEFLGTKRLNKNYLGIRLSIVKVLVRYDIENISDETYAKALETVFAEPPVDVRSMRG